ncbi:MAG: hypothetical protein MSA50_12155 [Veillonellaceae bacterium]|jgi:hypothetical protein|uniref:hypothetical protein n=1 Tax=uncultured Selenomonas sp. TaxID=159275 RepID=UPI0025DB3D80|nr:hypothetical protein [uncultured Selenomonas sp.]MCI7541303.1 hypothetical protein [Veillonellaceae bacterium]
MGEKESHLHACGKKGKKQKAAEIQKRLLETSGGLWYNINKEGADGGDRRLLPFVPFIRL